MKILIVEDEKELADSIKTYLEGNGFVCEIASNVNTAIDKIVSFEYDCVVLDLMLPDGNGFEVIQVIKKIEKNEGIIIISAKESLESKIDGLQLGADDYITKPFHLSELLVRIQALIRRKNFSGNNTVNFNEIEVEILSKIVKVNGEKVELTKKEFDLLLFLMGNENKVLSKSAIAEHLSGDMAYMLDNHDFVYAHIKNLKNKLKEAGCNDYIKTVYGLGYRWQNE
ncbi:MAG: response regulator transcription factor [Bacteroidales bacterium]|nr:response regulator transcription factor [Bacteroidales bacterium]HPD94841.1 response regulator transcription factor [Tenuifilaceae bacterium]HRX30514.1 response regulator transcription factor [Tenuifilaceae bacterium]